MSKIDGKCILEVFRYMLAVIQAGASCSDQTCLGFEFPIAGNHIIAQPYEEN